MTKAAEKWIDFGTGTGQVSAKSLPIAYSPLSYTPSATASETTDRVSAHLKGIDAKLGALGGGGVLAVENFDATSNQTVFQLATDIDEFQSIDVYVLGHKQREGEANAFERDVENNQIILSEGLPEDTWVEVVIFQTPTEQFDFTVPPGGQSSFNVSGLTATRKVDVWINGYKQREGALHAWTRNTVNQTITTTETVPEGNWVQVRVQ